jgi:hypothetical protein
VTGWEKLLYALSAVAEREPAIIFMLIDRLLGTLRDSGATEEESIAALRAVEAIVPAAGLQSAKRITIRT